MKETCRFGLAAALLCASFCMTPTRAEVLPRIVDVTRSRCWFAGASVTNAFRVEGVRNAEMIGQWRLSAAGRTVARGERALVAGSPLIAFDVTFALPEVKPGVVVDHVLDVAVVDAGDRRLVTATNKVIHSFAREAFAGRSAWLESLDITLFDSEKATTRLFDRSGIPHRFTRNSDGLAEVKGGTVIVGEGVSLKDYRGLWAELVDLASRGVPVLCLALKGGAAAVPGVGPSGSVVRPTALSLKRYGAVSELDKRLDRDTWCGSARTVAYSLAFEGSRGPVEARIGKGSADWLWLEQGFAGSDARLVLCQFRLVGLWDTSPVPRYMLLRILEELKQGSVRAE